MLTNLPRRGRSRHGHPPADLEEVVHLYGLRNWVEQGYKQVKQDSAGPIFRSAPTVRSAAI